MMAERETKTSAYKIFCLSDIHKVFEWKGIGMKKERRERKKMFRFLVKTICSCISTTNKMFVLNIQCPKAFLWNEIFIE